jgi:MFS family permease
VQEKNMVERIYWRQVWGLAALVGAIVFCWLAYGFYQPIILTRLGFGELAGVLGVFQGLLGAVAEPFAGLVADRYAQKIGQRLPLITMGMTLAGLIFIILSWLLAIDLPAGVRWVIPVLMTFWVLAMIVFRGPAVALLVKMAPTKVLPQANSILIFTFSIVGALAPVFDKFIAWVGAPITFLLGAAVLALGRWLLAVEPPQLPLVITTTSRSQQYPEMLRIYSTGLICGILSNLLLRWSPWIMATKLGGVEPNTLTATILAISALSVLFTKNWVQRWGNYRSMLVAIGIIAGLLVIAPIVPNLVLVVGYLLIAGLAFCLLSLAQIPWALGQLSQPGLATGLYFGGMGLATAIVSGLLLNWQITGTL